MFSAFWRASCWTASIALCFLILAVQDFVLAESPPQATPAKRKPAKTGAITRKVLVKISKETTFITAPLRQDGYPDYFAALNERMSKGVTPENNSSVLLLKAIGPGVVSEKFREKYFHKLGIPPLPVEGDYFLNSEEFVQRERDVERLSYDDSDNDFEKWSSLDQNRPWSKEEFPLIAKWLERNEKPLALAIEASKRSRRFDPYLCSADKDILLAASCSVSMRIRDVAKALSMRAFLRIHDGNLDGAWQDLLACHRLARLASQGYMLFEGLTGFAIDVTAMKGEEELLRHPNLTAAQIAKMRNDLAILPPMPKIIDKINLGERFVFLNFICVMARDGITSMNKGDGFLRSRDNSLADAFVDTFGCTMIDWNVPLRMGNSWYDQLVEAGRKPTRKERSNALGKLDDDLTALEKKKDRLSKGLSMLVNPSRSIGEQLSGILLPATGSVYLAEDRYYMHCQVHETAFALAAYRAEHGMYPKKLEYLVPKFMTNIPNDIFNKDATLCFNRSNSGGKCVLYSFGPNGIDDAGKDYDDSDGNCDDIVVRLEKDPQ